MKSPFLQIMLIISSLAAFSGSIAHAQATASKPALALAPAPTGTPKVKEFEVHNPRLKPVDISREPVTALATHPEWHIVKSAIGFRIYAKADASGLDSGGDKSPCGVVNFLVSSFAKLDSKLKSIEPSNGGGQVDSKVSTNQANGYCVAEIGASLPRAIGPLLYRHSFYDGPSGWTAVLFVNQMIATQRYTDDSEFTQLMGTPICRTVGKSELPLAGDIGIARNHLDDGRFRELNAFVLVAPDMVFTRDDGTRGSPYALESMNYFLTTQHLNTLPARCRDGDASNNSGCPTELIYKRCESLPNYRALHQLAPNLSPLKQSLDQILALEKRVEPFTLGQADLKDGELMDIITVHGASFDAFNAASEDLIKKVDPTDPAWLVASQDRSALVGVATQISAIAAQQSNTVTGETRYYAHEPWQAVVLGTTIPVGPSGPVTRYLLCAPFSRDPACPARLK